MVPYPGLRAFTHNDAAIFFGREAHTRQIMELLASMRFVAVVGPSGCGKSSLVRAGVVAAIHDAQTSVSHTNWWVGMMRPGSQPFRNLARALSRQSMLESPEQKVSIEESEIERDVLPYVQSGPEGLVELLSANPLPQNTNVLLVVDQFEDLFHAHRRGHAKESKSFVDLLLFSARQSRFPIHIVTTMRSELLGDCILFPGLPEIMTSSQFLVPLLTPEQQRAAILEPARLFGGDTETELVETLIEEMRDEADQLPLLQHCLMRIWLRAASRAGIDMSAPVSKSFSAGVHMTLEDYTAIGGFKHALSNHADETLWKLSRDQQRMAECMFRRLGDRRADRRYAGASVSIAEMAAIARTESDDMIEVVDVFRQPYSGFLIPDSSVPLDANSVIAFGHESLMRQWPRLKQWVEEEAHSAALYRHLEHSARLWEQGKAALWRSPDLDRALQWKRREQPSEVWASRYGRNFELALKFLHAASRRKRSLRKLLTAGIVLAGLLFAGLIGWGLWERRQRIQTQIRFDAAAASLSSPAPPPTSEPELDRERILGVNVKDARGLDLLAPNGRILLKPGERIVFETTLNHEDRQEIRVEYLHFLDDTVSDSPEYIAPDTPGELDMVVVGAVDSTSGRTLEQQVFKIKIIDKY